MYVGPKTSTGTGTVNTVYEVRNEKQASDLFGPGSPLHRSIRMHFLSWKGGKVSAVAYAASSGGSPGTATATITFSSAITGSGTATVYVCGQQFTAAYATTGSTTTVTNVAAAIASAINAATWLPLTASPSAGVVTLTAKIAGASQGDGTIGVYRLRASVSSGTGIAVATSGAALGLGSGTAGADGTTTEAVGLTNALAILTARRDYYMGFTTWSSTHLAIIKSHVNTKSLPSPGLRSRAFTGYTGTQSGASTLAIALNYERQHIVLQTNSEHDPAELAANVLALHQALEADRGGFVPDGYRNGVVNWNILPAAAEADWPDDPTSNNAVTDGIIIIDSDQAGSFMVMSLNTRSKDPGGTVADFRACETHRISYMDDFADTWLLRDKLTWQGFRLSDDERLPDGKINFNQILPPKTVTPSTYSKWFSNLVTEFGADGVLQRLSEWKSSLSCNIDPNNISRIEMGAAGRTYDLCHQRSLRLSENTPG